MEVMVKVTFYIIINALPNQVYDAMVNPEHVDNWVAIFSDREVWHEGSWAEGEEIAFYTYDKNGIAQGMICNITSHKPNEYVYVQPVGVWQGGKRIFEGDAVKGLDETFEEYIFTQQGNQTGLTINAGVDPKQKAFFEEKWPKALEVIKHTAENNH